MAIHHVVWDWNGTLLDDVSLIAQVTSRTLEGLGCAPLDLDGYRRAYRRPITALYEHLLGRSLPPGEFERLDAAWHHQYSQGLGACRLFDDVADALAEVTALGWTQSLCSMFPDAELRAIVDRLAVAGHFLRIDGIRGSRGGRKEAHLREHIEALSLTGAEVVVIGDSLDDAEAAAACGAAAVLLTTGLHAEHDLRAAGVAVVDTVTAALRTVAGDKSVAVATRPR